MLTISMLLLMYAIRIPELVPTLFYYSLHFIQDDRARRFPNGYDRQRRFSLGTRRHGCGTPGQFSILWNT